MMNIRPLSVGPLAPSFCILSRRQRFKSGSPPLLAGFSNNASVTGRAKTDESGSEDGAGGSRVDAAARGNEARTQPSRWAWMLGAHRIGRRFCEIQRRGCGHSCQLVQES